ncbi:hypothetical protein ACFQFQ_07725 [Sulfitobacter porphyrae]|uniref:Bulb-type lectin domain-containing protein n=1 Tax=Sulfitobacter porphyrae TaxID=1246864 RepID=A0ABW2B154_9RHOB|nr:hypothetical protein GCM10007928_49490 [Sulfitobacter porphyrae]
MISIRIEEWDLQIADGSLPSHFTSCLKNAEFVDQIDINNDEGRFLFLGISSGATNNGWPSVVVAQKYQDGRQTFSPGFLLVPDTSLLFLGAGERLLCYDLDKKVRLWEDETDCGFWGWSQSGSYILMSAELEFGVWDKSGKKLWSTFVEPPWSFAIKEQTVELDVMGTTQKFQLSDGVKLD